MIYLPVKGMMTVFDLDYRLKAVVGEAGVEQYEGKVYLVIFQDMKQKSVPEEEWAWVSLK